MVALPSFRGARLHVARLVADEPLTLYEIAQGLGRKPGSISGLVHRMHAEGLLVTAEDPPVRGSQFRLNPAHFGDLEHALSEHSPAGAVAPGRRTLLVRAPQRRALYEILARAAVAGSIDWVVDFDGSGSTLIVLQEQAGELDTDRLAIAFGDAGIDYRLGVFGQPMGGDALRRFAGSVRQPARAGGERAGVGG